MAKQLGLNIVGMAVLLTQAFSVQAAVEPNDKESYWEKESISGGFFGLNDQLEKYGLDAKLGLTQIYQQDVRGGTSTHRKAGRYTGSYDFEIDADMQKLAGFEGGSAYLLTEGGWSDGINDPSVGSNFNVNADAAGDRSADITQLWYEQMIGESLRVRLGKIDLTGGFECKGCPVTFDGNRFANDETSQFLNSALVNNPTIPFPDEGLGAIVFYNPVDWWYISGGISDAQADRRETGLNTAFSDEDYYFSIAETGFVPEINSEKGPLLGAYRFGVWYDPQDKEQFGDQGITRDDHGFYVSFDQTVWKENTDEDDEQGLGIFGRYGYARGNVNTFTNFISGGVSYTGLFDGRDDDVVAVGVAQGVLTDKSDFTANTETVYETYYNAAITKFMTLTPSLQYVINPGGYTQRDNAVVVAMRMQLTF